MGHTEAHRIGEIVNMEMVPWQLVILFMCNYTCTCTCTCTKVFCWCYADHDETNNVDADVHTSEDKRPISETAEEVDGSLLSAKSTSEISEKVVSTRL